MLMKFFVGFKKAQLKLGKYPDFYEAFIYKIGLFVL